MGWTDRVGRSRVLSLGAGIPHAVEWRPVLAVVPEFDDPRASLAVLFAAQADEPETVPAGHFFDGWLSHPFDCRLAVEICHPPQSLVRFK